jgi:hypothetical protein
MPDIKSLVPGVNLTQADNGKRDTARSRTVVH